MIVCIVGKSASGKSFICRYLESLDSRILHVDIDDISHYVLDLEEVQQELISTFGNSVVSDGNVNRKKLGEIVFESSSMMDKLTEITWPIMEKMIDNIIFQNDDKIILLDWLLLSKTKFFDMSDLKIWVDSPFDERVKRAIDRSHGTLSYEYFLKRDKSGIDYVDGIYDYFIDNKDIDSTKMEVGKVYEKCIVSREF